MAETRFVGVPQSLINVALADLASWRVIGERMLEMAKKDCPVGHVEQETGQYGPQQVGGSLKESMEVRFVSGVDPRILIGSRLTRGDKRVSALGLILDGTEGHPIDAKTDGGVLRFVSGGTVYFRAHVDHPGTKKNEFVQRAIRSVILESVTL